jgi:lysophospholipase L1-like esterase
MVLLCQGFAVFGAGCASTSPRPEEAVGPHQTVVLIMGDSISMENGYLKGLRGRLGESFEVVHNSGNGGDSANVLAHLETWVRAASPDIIHFNCGLHDLKLDRATGTHQVPLEQYRRNLDAITGWLKQHSDARLVFALTTPVNTEWHRKKKPFDRELSAVARYNQAAREIMERYGIPVNNLYGVISEAGPDTCLVADGVHMNEKGKALLADAVAAKIREIAAGD